MSGIEVPTWINSCLAPTDQITQQSAQIYIDKALDELNPLIAVLILFYVTCSIALICCYTMLYVCKIFYSMPEDE